MISSIALNIKMKILLLISSVNFSIYLLHASNQSMTYIMRNSSVSLFSWFIQEFKDLSRTS